MVIRITSMRQSWSATGVCGKEKDVFPSGKVFISKRISRITRQLAAVLGSRDDNQELFFILIVNVVENLQSEFLQQPGLVHVELEVDPIKSRGIRTNTCAVVKKGYQVLKDLRIVDIN